MAALPDAQRREAWAELMRRLTAADPVAVTKADLRAAMDAMDDYLDAMVTTRPATSANAAIPQPARSLLTERQKWLIFQFVVNWRVRHFFGEG